MHENELASYVAFENDVSVRDLGANLLQPHLFTHLFQCVHRELSGTTDIYGAKQGYIGFHDGDGLAAAEDIVDDRT
jgi:hypothetical protein